MDDALKWTLRLRVEGLSLWVNRGTHIDVLFPDDKERPGKHHFVTYSGGGLKERPMTGVTLDFTTLKTNEPLVIRGTLGWLEAEMEPGSVAADENAVFKSDGIVAALRLPLGILSPMPEALAGPFDLGNLKGMKLGYGVTWHAAIYGRKSVDVGWFEPKDAKASIQRLGEFDGGNTVQEFSIRCLSQDDRDHPTQVVQSEEVLRETQFIGHISRRDRKRLADAPVFKGTPPATDPGGSGMTTKGMDTYPKRPCPPSYARPFI